VEPYIRKDWIITAFQVAKEQAEEERLSLKAVRMSFKADRPFFPYREPEAKKEKPDDKKDRDKDNWRPYGRLLRVFFVSDTRVDGRLGPGVWHASIPWSDAISDEQRMQLVKETGVPEAELPAKAWLTTFEDRASPRPGKEDVYFDPAQDRTPIVPPPFVKYHNVHVPFDCVLVGVALLVLIAAPIAVKIMRKKPA